MFLPRKSNKAGTAASAEKAAAAAAQRPWVEKYRPRSIDDVSAQEHTVAVLRKTLMSTNLPHMLFYGPPGTGKTSTILALARQLFGPELMRSRVLELNASDERGISVVRDKIKNFAKMAVSNPDSDFPCPPYKIIVLDEADSMTQDAQSALRRIMEQYSRITRFCLVCNYVTRIIEPLASRCSKFRFRMLDVGSTQARLEHIAREEGVQFEEGVLDTLVHTSDGDLRRAITYLQSAARLHSSSAAPQAAATATAQADKDTSTTTTTAQAAPHAQRTPITPQSIVEIAGVVPHGVIVRLAAAAGIEPPPREGDAMDVDGDDAVGAAGAAGAAGTAGAAPSFDACHATVKSLARQGYSASQLLLQLHDYVVSHATLPALVKARCAIAFGEADKALVDGADEELQLLSCVLKVLRGVQAQGQAQAGR